MKDRCRNPNVSNYKYYGGKGISYDPSWDSYDQFLIDMGKRPKGKTIDRIDGNKDYSKENCKWSTINEQQRNRKSCFYITYQGVTKTAAEWSVSLGLVKGTVWNRIKLLGWSVEKAVTTRKVGA